MTAPDEGDLTDVTDLNEALAGATVLEIGWQGPYRNAGDQAPRSVRLGVRLRDGRPFSLQVHCLLSDVVVEALARESGTFLTLTGSEAFRWAHLDPGLVFEVALYSRAERVAEGETDPLAEAVAPLWAGTAAAPVAGVLERIGALRERLESVRSEVDAAVEGLEAIG